MGACAAVRLIASAVLLVGLGGCGNKDAELAARGRVDDHAAVRVAVRITVGAPPSVVWAVLGDVAGWPSWQPDIRATAIAGAAGIGVPFRWTTGDNTIRSRFMLVEPERRLAWIGHVLTVRAIHVWTLAALADGGTAASTEESLAGWPVGLLVSPGDLERTDRRWLEALKREAERRTGTAALRP